MPEIKRLENEINQIKERNRRVELDKAWETSNARKAMIAVLTYIVIVIFLFSVGLPNPLVNAIVPTIGFLLSTLTLSFAKKYWIENISKK